MACLLMVIGIWAIPALTHHDKQDQVSEQQVMPNTASEPHTLPKLASLKINPKDGTLFSTIFFHVIASDKHYLYERYLLGWLSH